MENNTKEKTTVWHVLLVVSFFALLVFLLVFEVKTADKKYSQTENRSLEQKPKISLSSVASGNYMSRFESYMSDQFPLRDKAVAYKSLAQRMLGITHINNVYIGRDGRLFEEQSKFNEKNVSETVNSICEFSKECKIKNQVFMLVPNSTYFLSGKLPRYLSFDSQAEQIEKICGMLPENMKKIDTVKMFDGVENKQKLYYRTDHHWTTRGARTAFYFAAPELKIDPSKTEYEFYTVSNDFYGTLASSCGVYNTPDKVEICIPVNSAGSYFVNNADKKEKTPSLFDLSKLEEKNKYEVFTGGNFSRLTISTTNLNGRSLLILKDSYANCFIPFLTPYFQNIVVIDARYFTDNINDVLSDYNFTDMLILYNVNTFLEDTSLKDILQKPKQNK